MRISDWSSDVCSSDLLIDEQHPDVALLDIALSGEQSFPIADRLSELGVPFAFVTGLAAEALPARFRQAPMLSKPPTTSALTRIVEALIVAGPDPTDMVNACGGSSATTPEIGRAPCRERG